jgi:hypothetical protein
MVVSMFEAPGLVGGTGWLGAAPQAANASAATNEAAKMTAAERPPCPYDAEDGRFALGGRSRIGRHNVRDLDDGAGRDWTLMTRPLLRHTSACRPPA